MNLGDKVEPPWGRHLNPLIEICLLIGLVFMLVVVIRLR